MDICESEQDTTQEKYREAPLPQTAPSRQLLSQKPHLGYLAPTYGWVFTADSYPPAETKSGITECSKSRSGFKLELQRQILWGRI